MDQACADRRLREPCWEGAQEARTGTVGTGLGGQRWAVGTSFWALSKLGAKVHQRGTLSLVAFPLWLGKAFLLTLG